MPNSDLEAGIILCCNEECGKQISKNDCKEFVLFVCRVNLSKFLQFPPSKLEYPSTVRHTYYARG